MAPQSESGDAGIVRRNVDRRQILGVAGLCAAAFLIRCIAWQRTGVMFNDGPVFIGLARLISNGEWAAVLAHPFYPLYPMTVAVAHEFFERSNPGLRD